MIGSVYVINSRKWNFRGVLYITSTKTVYIAILYIVAYYNVKVKMKTTF